MTREEHILNKAIDYSEIEENFLEYDDCGDVCDDKDFVEKAFIEGAKWADEHPDSKHTYTKQQLIDMGFTFTTNGDIVTPDQLNEDLKKYLEYQKQKFIEKSKEWLERTLYIHTEIEKVNYWGIINSDSWVTSDYESVEDFINSFCKVMEE